MITKRLAFALIVSLVLASCRSKLHALSQALPRQEIIRLSASEYLDLAWIDNETIVITDYDNYPEIWELDIASDKLTPLHLQATCKKPYTRALQALPNGNAGFVLSCPEPKSQIIQEIDRSTDTTSDIYVEPSIIWLGRFSYSQNMTELILVDVNGLYLESTLYHVDRNGKRTNITADFQRADFPAWSPTEDVVAFLGTKPYSETEDPKNWGQIENLFDYPWTLYFYYPQSQKAEELPIEVVHPGRFKWSPDGKLLAFTGKYEGVPGVWIIDRQNNLEVRRVVNTIASFDFSPDSTSMAYIADSSAEGQDAVYVIDLTNIEVHP